MFCKYCGSNNPEGIAVCSACGSVMGGDAVNNSAGNAEVNVIDTAVDNSYVQPQQTVPVQPVQTSYPVQPPVVPADETVSFGDWFLSIFLMKIPLVNLIVSLVFAFSSGTKKSKSNFFKANLVWMVISTVLSILAGVFMVVFGYEIIEELLWELGMYW